MFVAPHVRADYAAAFLEAAADLGADAFQVNIRKHPGSFFGPGNSLKGNAPAIAALKGVDMVIDLVGLLWSKEQTEITAAGVNGGGIMLHAERSDGPVAAAQKCATHGPLSVATRDRPYPYRRCAT